MENLWNKIKDSKRNSKEWDIAKIIINVILAGFISFIISQCSIVSNNRNIEKQIISNTKNLEWQIKNINRPVVNLESFEYLDFNEKFKIDFCSKYEEYTIIKSSNYDERKKLSGILPIKIKLSNAGNGNLFDLKLYSLLNEKPTNIVDNITLKNNIENNYLEKFDSSIYATASVIYSTISPLNIKVDRDVNKNIVLLHQQQTMYLESKTYSEAYAICFYRDINKNVYKALIEINYIVPIQKEESPNVYFTLQSLQCSLFQEDSIKYNNIIKNNEKLKEEISKYEQLYCDGIE